MEAEAVAQKKTQTLDRLCCFPGSLTTILALQLLKQPKLYQYVSIYFFLAQGLCKVIVIKR